MAFLVFSSSVWRQENIGIEENKAERRGPEARQIIKKTKEELVVEALEKSRAIKGLYMTADVAGDSGAGATRLRQHIVQLAETTEINGIVIDVKEVCGPDVRAEHIQRLITELHQKNIWAIARIVVFKDASQIYMHPEWYLHRTAYKSVVDECAKKKYLRAKNPGGEDSATIFWQDNKGGYWLDPANQNVQEYIVDFSKRIIDLGFDELQFDYIRFPSDGDVEVAQYPSWDGKTAKYKIMKSFFEFLHESLKSYKPDIILSADLFGYAAIRAGDVGIGQRLEDIGHTFDYVSFMVYPSHYYSGLYMPEDTSRALPAVNFNRFQARMHPEVVVARSLAAARDFLDGKLLGASATSTVRSFSATSTPLRSSVPISSISRVRLRPWLEDFFHEDDRLSGRPYGIEKVRMQIDAAESIEPHGWLLWNASNVYTEGALKKEGL